MWQEKKSELEDVPLVLRYQQQSLHYTKTNQHLLKVVNPSAEGKSAPFHEEDDFVSVVSECRLQLPHTIQGNKTKRKQVLACYQCCYQTQWRH